jgi:hypothetical protein
MRLTYVIHDRAWGVAGGSGYTRSLRSSVGLSLGESQERLDSMKSTVKAVLSFGDWLKQHERASEMSRRWGVAYDQRT